MSERGRGEEHAAVHARVANERTNEPVSAVTDRSLGLLRSNIVNQLLTCRNRPRSHINERRNTRRAPPRPRGGTRGRARRGVANERTNERVSAVTDRSSWGFYANIVNQLLTCRNRPRSHINERRNTRRAPPRPRGGTRGRARRGVANERTNERVSAVTDRSSWGFYADRVIGYLCAGTARDHI